MLKETIESELKQALRNKEALRLSVFRMLSAAVHNREIEKRTTGKENKEVPLSEEELMQVVRAEMKKRKDAAEAYDRGGRPAQASQEREEAKILSPLLPPELSDEELEALVSSGKEAAGAATPKDFGRLMGWVMQRAKGRAGSSRVSEIIKRHLGGL